MKNILLFLLLISLLSFPVFAGPQSTTYELKEYGFGMGGTQYNDSTTYSLFGNIGEDQNGSTNSTTTFTMNQGLVFTLQTDTQSAPTFTNPGSNYDRLKFVINQTGTSPIGTDIAYLLQVSTDSSFATNNKYIQADDTLGSSMVWQTYTNWGGSSGQYITGLTNNTFYYIRIKARQGKFTESPWSQSATATTSDPSLTFGINSSTITFDNLNPGNSYTDNTKSTIFTTSTNAYNGYIIYGRDTSALDTTIPNYSAPNSAPTTWSSGAGFGYTTNDSSLSGGTADRFTNGGPKYAGFTTSSPGDPVADHAGPIISPISNENFTISYKVTAATTTNAGRYTSTVLYVVVPTY
jgi:hypothetical protein